MIPIEVGEPLTRRLLFQQQQNEENMRVELETTEEVQEMARIRGKAAKLHAMRRYNTKVLAWGVFTRHIWDNKGNLYSNTFNKNSTSLPFHISLIKTRASIVVALRLLKPKVHPW